MTQAESDAHLRTSSQKISKSIEEVKVLRMTMDNLVQRTDELQKLVGKGGEITPELKEASNEVARLVSQARNEIPEITPLASANVPVEPKKEEPKKEETDKPQGHSPVFGDKKEEKE